MCDTNIILSQYFKYIYMNIFVIIFIHFYFIDEKSQLHMVKLNDNHDPTVSFINLICLSQ